jgi:hypothetical protein
MTLNDELSALEAVANECEKEIAAGTLNADALVKQICAVTDPNAMILKGKDIIVEILGRANKINVVRLKELKHQHPNDARVSKVVSQAANCYMKLMEIGLSISEGMADEHLRPELQIQNRTAMNGVKMLVADLL